MRRANRKLRILIADDHALVRKGIKALLHSEQSWKTVGEAADGLEAVAKAIILQPDIAILDIGMPKADGLAVARLIRTESPNTKIIFLTMHESRQMVGRVLETGARGYVLKSDLVDQLVLAIRGVVRGKLGLSPKVVEIMSEGFARSRENAEIRNTLPKLTERETESVRLAEDSNSIALEEANGQLERLARRLTMRETQVVQFLAAGKSNKEIAAALSLSVKTIETYRTRVMLKLDVHSVSELAIFAVRNHMIAM